jgi:hypothetical protein
MRMVSPGPMTSRVGCAHPGIETIHTASMHNASLAAGISCSAPIFRSVSMDLALMLEIREPHSIVNIE